MQYPLDPFDGQDHSNDVVVYRGVVRFGLEVSSIWRSPTASDEELRRILEAPPSVRWWPPRLTGDRAVDLELLILGQLLAAASIGAELPHSDDPARFKTAIFAKYPSLDPAKHATDREKYASHRLTVAIDRDGSNSMTLAKNTRGDALPGVAHIPGRGKRPDFLVYIQEVVRGDLLARIDAVRQTLAGTQRQ
ncbi:MAG: hypothetical protein ABSB67_14880 [Bryobacteraceae bacterium]|jgi:hypothetical protein